MCSSDFSGKWKLFIDKISLNLHPYRLIKITNGFNSLSTFNRQRNVSFNLVDAKRIWFQSSSTQMVTSVESRSIPALVVSIAVSYVKIDREDIGRDVFSVTG